MQIKNYTLVSKDKVRRILDANKDISDKDLLVQYDKVGGLIVEEKKNVKRGIVTGSFYDFEEKKGRKKPKLTYK